MIIVIIRKYYNNNNSSNNNNNNNNFSILAHMFIFSLIVYIKKKFLLTVLTGEV
jgi:hypothetical protein